MKIFAIIGIFIMLVMIFFYDYFLLKGKKREMSIYLILMIVAFVLSIFLTYNPNLYGPSDLLSQLLQPLQPFGNK